MNNSFYHYLMKYRDLKPQDEISKFANCAYEDHSFPKHSKDYHELSTYLEMHGLYLQSMTIFDEVWDLYILEAKKD